MSLESQHMNISQTKDEIVSIYDLNDNYVGVDSRLNMRKKKFNSSLYNNINIK